MDVLFPPAAGGGVRFGAFRSGLKVGEASVKKMFWDCCCGAGVANFCSAEPETGGLVIVFPFAKPKKYFLGI